MVVENSTWEAPRIHGEILMLGFDVSEQTVSRWMLGARFAILGPDIVFTAEICGKPITIIAECKSQGEPRYVREAAEQNSCESTRRTIQAHILW